MSDYDTTMRAARAAMDAHGLAHWKLGSEYNIDDLARTNVLSKVILLSRPYIRELDDEDNRENYMHEIAHAMVNEKYGIEEQEHGPHWHKQMAELGYPNAKSRSDSPLPVPKKYLEDPDNPGSDLNMDGELWNMRREVKEMDGPNALRWYHPEAQHA